MFETKVTYSSQQRRQYITPWIRVRNVELRGGMMQGVSGADVTDSNDEKGDPIERVKFSNPFDSDFFDYGYDDQSQY